MNEDILQTLATNVSKEEGGKVLEVKDLRISFKTMNGTVKAVRGISFSLYKGKTLAIVGESGSGKSVTSRAILGILAGNRIIEGGQILYDGRDLLTLSEEQFTKLRGSRISMIFQDPMSSLNPLMKVGKQITEAIVLKKKADIRHIGKNVFNKKKQIKKFLRDEDNNFLSRLNEHVRQYIYVNREHSFWDKLVYLPLSFFLSIPNTFMRLGEKISNIFKRLTHQEIKPLTIKTGVNYYINLYHEAQKERYTSKLKENNPYLLDTLARVSVVAYETSINNKKRAIEELKNEVAYILEHNGTEVYLKLKSISKDLATLVQSSDYTLALSKDDVTLTFYSALKKYLKDLTIALNLVGVIQKRDTVKQRAFSHEISETPEQVVNKIRVLFEFLIAKYQKDILVPLASNYEEILLNYFTGEGLRKADIRIKHSEIKNMAIKLLEEVGIPEARKRANQYPFQFSGGMRQRIVIAISLASNPEILICDEPTTALDVTIQAQILELINKLKVERSLSVIFITHDLGVVANMADDIAVMYAGKIVEFGSVYDLFYDPRHPYTWALLSSMPDLSTKEKLEAIPGTPPNMILPPKGDAFATRNKYAMQIDFEQEPPEYAVSATHWAATWLLHPEAPKVEMPKIVKERIENSLKRGIDNE
jgi:oligopeptide/dipeptide ABC transporter ATP-binding protein